MVYELFEIVYLSGMKKQLLNININQIKHSDNREF